MGDFEQPITSGTAAAAADQKVISECLAHHYEKELNTGKFKKGGQLLTAEDRSMRIKALER